MPFDLLKQEVRIADCAWPVSVDCSRGIATLEMSGRHYEVRSLTWAQKRNLARFGKFGPEFFRQQLIAATTGTPLPASAVEREALLSVTAWLNAAPAEIPFDHVLLARMTVELARWTGCSVSTLDECTAADVEALWAARKEGGAPGLKGMPPETFSRGSDLNTASSVGDLPEGFRRIVIVPDKPRATEGAVPPLVESIDSLPAVDRATPVVPATLPELLEPESEPNPILLEPPAVAVGKAAVDVAAADEETRAHRTAVSVAPMETAPEQVAVRNETAATHSRRGRGDLTAATVRRRPGSTFRLMYPAPPPIPAPSAKKHGWDSSPSMPPSVSTEWPATRTEVSRVASPIVQQAAMPPAPPISPIGRPAEVDRDDLLDEFADRLEEAAASAGVDVFR